MPLPIPTFAAATRGVLAALLILAAEPSQAAALPTAVGQCSQTTVAKIGTRLEDGVTGKPVAGSGSAITYANGGTQVSYDQIPGIDHSRAGDAVTVCLVVLPENCPKGDDRGKVYLAINARTSESWEAPDSEHSCGGA